LIRKEVDVLEKKIKLQDKEHSEEMEHSHSAHVLVKEQLNAKFEEMQKIYQDQKTLLEEEREKSYIYKQKNEMLTLRNAEMAKENRDFTRKMIDMKDELAATQLKLQRFKGRVDFVEKEKSKLLSETVKIKHQLLEVTMKEGFRDG
jgi:hypothetical protein